MQPERCIPTYETWEIGSQIVKNGRSFPGRALAPKTEVNGWVLERALPKKLKRLGQVFFSKEPQKVLVNITVLRLSTPRHDLIALTHDNTHID